MTTNKPEVVGFATHHDEPMLLPSKGEATIYCDDGEEPVALIRLSDYERLQAECEELLKDAEFGRSVLAKREPGKAYGCHCDLDEGMEPDGCVIDSGERHNCIYAKGISVKEQCEYWRVIAIDAAMEGAKP